MSYEDIKDKSFDKRTAEEQQAIARQGGIASGKARAEKRDLRKALEMLLEKEYRDKNGNTATGAVVISTKLFEKATKGDIKAFEVIRDTAGQKPVEKVETTQTVLDMSQFTTEQIKEMLDDDVPG